LKGWPGGRRSRGSRNWVKAERIKLKKGSKRVQGEADIGPQKGEKRSGLGGRRLRHRARQGSKVFWGGKRNSGKKKKKKKTS